MGTGKLWMYLLTQRGLCFGLFFQNMLWNSFRIFLWKLRDVLFEEKSVDYHWSKRNLECRAQAIKISDFIYLECCFILFWDFIFLGFFFFFFVLLAKTSCWRQVTYLVESLFKSTCTFLKKSEDF